MSLLKFQYRLRPRRMSKAKGRNEVGHGLGPEGRIQKLRELVTSLVRHERIEGHYNHLDEARPYAELLIQKAQRHGDRHRETMELADYWLLEKDLVHKLFKVLAPRYTGFPSSFTRMHMLPRVYPGRALNVGCLELKGNPWPPVNPHHRDLNGTLINVLVDGVKREHEKQLYAQAPPPSAPDSSSSSSSSPSTSSSSSSSSTDTPPQQTNPSTPETSVPKEGTPV